MASSAVSWSRPRGDGADRLVSDRPGLAGSVAEGLGDVTVEGTHHAGVVVDHGVGVEGRDRRIHGLKHLIRSAADLSSLLVVAARHCDIAQGPEQGVQNRRLPSREAAQLPAHQIEVVPQVPVRDDDPPFPCLIQVQGRPEMAAGEAGQQVGHVANGMGCGHRVVGGWRHRTHGDVLQLPEAEADVLGRVRWSV